VARTEHEEPVAESEQHECRTTDQTAHGLQAELQRQGADLGTVRAA